MSDEDLTLNDMQAIVDDWIGQWEEGYWPPLSNLARLTEEVGELGRVLNHVYGEKKKKEDEALGDIEMELGDILFVAVAIANSLDIDLEQSFRRVMEKYDMRDRDRWTPADDT